MSLPNVWSRVRLVVAALAVLGLAGPVAAGEQVPFKGSLEGDFTTSVNFPIVSVIVDATGNATQLGKFTLTIPHEANLVSLSATGTYNFTATNGDMVFATSVGQATPTSDPNVLSVVEIATITGGTGRFAGATGSFTAERLVDLITLTTSGSFNGTIS